MKYKITIEEVTEYEEKETVYESKTSGTRYYSRYHADIANGKKGVDFVEKAYPTGRMLTRKDEIYSQEFESDSIKKIIKAVNAL